MGFGKEDLDLVLAPASSPVFLLFFRFDSSKFDGSVFVLFVLIRFRYGIEPSIGGGGHQRLIVVVHSQALGLELDILGTWFGKRRFWVSLVFCYLGVE
jgi:hypothetical protein